MKRWFVLSAVMAAFLTMATGVAFAGPGDPIPNVGVGLDHDPPDGINIVARGVTNKEGSVTFAKLKAGHYTFAILDTSKLPGPSQVLVSSGSTKLPGSAVILPGKRPGLVFAMDEGQRKLGVVVYKDGEDITVRVRAAK